MENDFGIMTASKDSVMLTSMLPSFRLTNSEALRQ